MSKLEKCSNGRCLIPSGTFQMGDANGDRDEQPVKTVTMSAFLLGQTEVSISEYYKHSQTTSENLQSVMDGQMCYIDTGVKQLGNTCTENDYPIGDLSMREKRDYCQSKGGDLATAAQLHFASRFDELDSIINGKDERILNVNGHEMQSSVFEGYKNRFGVYNLLGNVWETALDAYDEDFYSRMTLMDPYNPMTYGPSGQPMQTLELSGGSFSARFHSRGLRAADRQSAFSMGVDFIVGFRCAWPLPVDSK